MSPTRHSRRTLPAALKDFVLYDSSSLQGEGSTAASHHHHHASSLSVVDGGKVRSPSPCLSLSSPLPMKDGTVKMAGTTAVGGKKRSPEEREEKLKARIVRNRIAAQVSREKKRQQMDDLEATNSVLLAEIQSLKDHLKSAETEKNLLSVQVQALSNTVASLQSHLFNNGSSSLALAPSTPDSLSLAPSPLPYQSDTTSPVSTTSSPSNLLETEDLFADLSAFFPTTPSAPSSFTSTTFPTFDLSQPAPFDPLSYLLSPLPTFTLPNTTRPEPAVFPSVLPTPTPRTTLSSLIPSSLRRHRPLRTTRHPRPSTRKPARTCSRRVSRVDRRRVSKCGR